MIVGECWCFGVVWFIVFVRIFVNFVLKLDFRLLLIMMSGIFSMV